MKNIISKNKKAVALVLAMFILVFISILVVAFLNLLTSDLVITTNHLGRLKALYIAEAGVEYAISRLRADKNWSVTQEWTVFPSGSTSSWTVTYPKSGTARVIESSSQVDNNKFQAKVEAKVSIRGTSNPWTIKIVSYQETN